ncbi:hypothetical protein ACLOJK_009267 [Asimina triloba]
MTLEKSSSVRFIDVQVKHSTPLIDETETKQQYNMDGTEAFESSSKNTSGIQNIGSGSSQAIVATRVFAEEYEKVHKTILDPQGSVVIRWNMIFLVACTVSLFIDPLFFYLPKVRDGVCIDTEQALQIVLTAIRSVVDLFYAIQIVIRFRTSFVAPSSRIFGRGELVIDPSKIAARYLANWFWIDLIASLPLPQILIWAIIPNLNGWIVTDTNYVLRLVIGIQYLPRVYLIFPLCSRIIKVTGVIAQRAWAAAFYNLVLYLLVGHLECDADSLEFSFGRSPVLVGIFYRRNGKNYAGERPVTSKNHSAITTSSTVEGRAVQGMRGWDRATSRTYATLTAASFNSGSMQMQ